MNGKHWGKESRSRREREFLKGPISRLRDIASAVRIFHEFLSGYRHLGGTGPCVTVFGSARFGSTNPYYRTAREVGRVLAENDWTGMTGGGPGIMEAANRGAKDGGGRSIGCNIKLPKEQELLQMPGRGSLDFVPVVKALKNINYKGWTEIFMHPVPRGIPILDSVQDVTAEINRSRRYLEDCLKKV